MNEIIIEKGIKYSLVKVDFDPTKETTDVQVCGNHDYQNEKVVIPDEFKTKYDGYDVTCKVKEIAENAFMDNQHIKELELPASIDTIGKNFITNIALSKIVVHAENPYFEVKDEQVLYYYGNIKHCLYCIHTEAKECVIEEGTKRIRSGAFYSLQNLESLILPETLTYIEDGAFVGCENLKILRVNATDPPRCEANALSGIPETCIILVPKGSEENYGKHAKWKRFSTIISEIPQSFQEGGINYTQVNFDKRTVLVGDNKKAKGDIIVPEEVEHNVPYKVIGIEENAFCGAQLSSITIAEGLSLIGNSAFKKAKIASETMHIPASVATIGDDAFYKCEVKEFTSSGSNFSVIDGLLVKDDKLIQYPMLKEEFQYKIEDSPITTIGKHAFASVSQLRRLQILDHINTIEDAAFDDCKELNTIEISQDTPPQTEKKSLNGIASNCVVIVPKGKIGNYQKNNGWKGFTIIDAIPDNLTHQGVKYTVEDFFAEECKERHISAADQLVEKSSIIPKVDGTITINKIKYKIIEVGNIVKYLDSRRFTIDKVTYTIATDDITKVDVKLQTIAANKYSDVKILSKGEDIEWEGFTFQIRKVEKITIEPTFTEFKDEKGITYKVESSDKSRVNVPTQPIVDKTLIQKSVSYHGFEFCINSNNAFDTFESNGVKYNIESVKDMTVRVPNQSIQNFNSIKIGDKVSFSNFKFTIAKIDSILPSFDSFTKDNIKYHVVTGSNSLVEIRTQTIETEHKNNIKIPAVGSDVQRDGFTFKIRKVEAVAIVPSFREFLSDTVQYQVDSNDKSKVNVPLQPVRNVLSVGSIVSYNGFNFIIKNSQAFNTFTYNDVRYKVENGAQKTVSVPDQTIADLNAVFGLGQKLTYSGFTFRVISVGEITPTFSTFTYGGINYKVISHIDKTAEVDKNPNASGAITIPSSVKYNGITFNVVRIGDNAFNQNFKIKSVILPNTIETIGVWAFLMIDFTNSFGLPASVKEIGRDAFYNCNFPGWNVAQGNRHFKSIDGVLFDYSGKRLIHYPWANTVGHDSYSVAEGITTIATSAFASCTNPKLQTIVLPSTLEVLEDNAFYACYVTGLIIRRVTPPIVGKNSLAGLPKTCNTIIVPKGCVSRYRSAEGWKKFINIIDEIPSTFTYNGINYNVLSFADRTVEVGKNSNASGAITIPSSVAYNGFTFNVVAVGDYAFDRNKNITSVRLPNNIKKVGFIAFQTLRIQMQLPTGLEVAGRSAFTYNKFADLRLPVGLKELRESSFGYTTVTSKRAYIPNTVIAIIGNPFYGSSLESIEVASDNPNYKSINGVLFNKNGSKILVYPAEKPSSTYSIPSGVRTIGKNSFENNRNLTELSIPATVEQLDSCALWYCPSLRQITISATTPPKVLDKALNGVSDSCIIKVPKGYVNAYKNAEGWKKFKNIIAL